MSFSWFSCQRLMFVCFSIKPTSGPHLVRFELRDASVKIWRKRVSHNVLAATRKLNFWSWLRWERVKENEWEDEVGWWMTSENWKHLKMAAICFCQKVKNVSRFLSESEGTSALTVSQTSHQMPQLTRSVFVIANVEASLRIRFAAAGNRSMHMKTNNFCIQKPCLLSFFLL